MTLPIAPRPITEMSVMFRPRIQYAISLRRQAEATRSSMELLTAADQVRELMHVRHFGQFHVTINFGFGGRFTSCSPADD